MAPDFVVVKANGKIGCMPTTFSSLGHLKTFRT